MYRCEKCRERFTRPVEIIDPAVYDEPFDACPKCGDERIEEYEPCPVCGIAEPLSFLPICKACALSELEAMSSEAELFGGIGRKSILAWLRKMI